MKILAFETSCDETSAAVLNCDDSNNKVLSNIISSQLFHSEFGGVVPEIASREHLKNISHITKQALEKANITLKDIDLVCATSEPGLIGALLVGLNYAKALACAIKKPFVPVNHILSHLFSNMLSGQQEKFPFIGLIVSGGHTLLVLVKNYTDIKILGSTIDDAAGEAFDKVAKILGLGYPGGPVVDRFAKQGDYRYHKFPLAIVKDTEHDFSFSGIKTSVLYYLRKINFNDVKNDKLIADVCASFQYAVVESLYKRTLDACKKHGVKIISVSGGVSANSALKEKFNSLKENGFEIYFPEIQFSMDNAAMIGLTGYLKYINSNNKDYYIAESLKTNAKARLDYEKFELI
ncbi:MAG: tRNA (adenosine(37)-N6)-threonylcarbamoyltransferase complex transferase subunit TsaD [Bacteroidetes bacterium]|nr:tRNA (adenosine(37)-N6)-threonylcarbamoyltransferase complex transferase subunit TsaD [Bacteroidota bacterium]